MQTLYYLIEHISAGIHLDDIIGIFFDLFYFEDTVSLCRSG